MCFTETHTNDSRFQRIEKYHPDWRSIHHPSAQHGLAICYNTKKVVIEKEFPETSSIELLPLLMNIDGKIILIVLVYRPPGGQRDLFIYQLLQELSMLEETRHYRTILCGDFNLDQMIQDNVDAFHQLCECFKFVQRVKYSTHIHGGILDLVFDQEGTEAVQWMPTAYSDHFTIIIDL